MLKKLLFTILFLSIAGFAQATTRCVSSGVGAGAVTAGSDSNSGIGDGSNPATTCKQSLSAILSTMAGGDTVVIRGGENDTVLGLADGAGRSIIPSGSDWNHATTFIAYTGERPIFRRFIDPLSPYPEQQIRDGIHLPTPQQCGPIQPGIVNYPCIYGGGGNACGYTQTGNDFNPGAPGHNFCFLAWQADYPGWMGGGVVQMAGGHARYVVFDGIVMDARGIVANVWQATCNSVCPGTDADIAAGNAQVTPADPNDLADLPKHIKFQNGEWLNSINSCMASPGYNDYTDSDIQFINMKVHHCGVPFDTHYYNDDPTQGLARAHSSAHYYHGFYAHTGGIHVSNSEAYAIAGSGFPVFPDVTNSYNHDNNSYDNVGGALNYSGNVYYNVGACNGAVRVYNYGGALVRNNTFIAGPKYTNPPSQEFQCPGSTSAVYTDHAYDMTLENNVFEGFDTGLQSTSEFGAGGCIRVFQSDGSFYNQTTSGILVRNDFIRNAKNTATMVNNLAPSNTDCSGSTVSSAPITSNNILNVNPQFASTNLPYYLLSTGSPLRGAGHTNTLTTDFLGNPFNSPPDIGAFQYCSGGGCAVPGTTALVHVYSASPSTGVSISYVVNSGNCNLTSPQSTTFTLSCDINTSLTLTAPSTASSNNFLNWVGSCTSSTVTCQVAVTGPQSVTAQYGGSLASYSLTVSSINPSVGLTISCSPLDNNGQGTGSTGFNRVYSQGTIVTCTAPATDGGSNTFNAWQNADSVSGTGNRTATVTMNSAKTITAAYNIGSTPGCGLVKSLPNGTAVTEGCDGFAHNVRDAANGNVIGSQPVGATGTIVGSSVVAGNGTWQQVTFQNAPSGWVLNDFLVPSGGGGQVIYTLTVASTNPATGISIACSPNDNNGNGNGSTPFTRSYNSGVTVNCTAPSVSGSANFINWLNCDTAAGTGCTITLTANATITASYQTGGNQGAQCNVDKVLTVGTPISTCDKVNQTSGPPNFTYIGCQLPGATGTVIGTGVNNSGSPIVQVQYSSNHQTTNANGYDCTGASGSPTSIGWSSRLSLIPATGQTATYNLTVNTTNPATGVTIRVSPTDKNGNDIGSAPFIRSYDVNTALNPNVTVAAVAPATAGANTFSSWMNCTTTTTTTVTGDTCNVTLSADRTITASYAAVSFTITQSNYRFYALRTASNALVPLAGLNVSGVSVVKGGKFIVVNQVDSSGNPPSVGTVLYYSRNGGAYAAIPSSFATDHIRLSPVIDVDVPANGATIAACLAGGLTVVTGNINNAAVTFDLPNNGCTTVGRKIEIESTATPGDTYTLREYLQDGTPLDAYTASGGVTIIGNQASGGF